MTCTDSWGAVAPAAAPAAPTATLWRATGHRSGIAVFGCTPDQAPLFRTTALRLGVRLTLTEAPLSEATAHLAAGNRCLSIDHKTPVSNATLLALRAAGVAYVSTRSVGCNHVDAVFAARIGITVENVAYSPDSVADYTLMLILMALRHAKTVVTSAQARDYRLRDTRGRELRDLTVGVVGTGRIGSAVIDRLGGFGCRILAHDRREKTRAQYVGLDELLRRSDVVTLHTPLTAESHHLLDRERLAKMRDGAVVVNTGRGGLVDTGALLAELETGRLGGAALDVVEGEESAFYRDRRHAYVDGTLARLQELPTVILTPHIAFDTDHALRDMVESSLTNCVRFDESRTA